MEGKREGCEPTNGNAAREEVVRFLKGGLAGQAAEIARQDAIQRRQKCTRFGDRTWAKYASSSSRSL